LPKPCLPRGGEEGGEEATEERREGEKARRLEEEEVKAATSA